MEIYSSELLIRIIIAIPSGIGAVALFILGNKRFGRFYLFDYQGNSKERFKDNLICNIYNGLAIACLCLAFFSIQSEKLHWTAFLTVFLYALCAAAFYIPIGILGSYWRVYQAYKLWGGFIPTIKERYGYTQPQPIKGGKIDPSRIKLPLRTMISALLVSLIAASITYIVLHVLGWNGSPITGIIFRLGASGLMGFGIFIIIASAALSRRIQKLRNGEVLDD